MRFIPTLITIVLLASLAFAGYKAYERFTRYEAAVEYLFKTTTIKNDKEESLTRAQVLDLIIMEAVKAGNEKKGAH